MNDSYSKIAKITKGKRTVVVVPKKIAEIINSNKEDYYIKFTIHKDNTLEAESVKRYGEEVKPTPDKIHQEIINIQKEIYKRQNQTDNHINTNLEDISTKLENVLSIIQEKNI